MSLVSIMIRQHGDMHQVLRQSQMVLCQLLGVAAGQGLLPAANRSLRDDGIVLSAEVSGLTTAPSSIGMQQLSCGAHAWLQDAASPAPSSGLLQPALDASWDTQGQQHVSPAGLPGPWVQPIQTQQLQHQHWQCQPQHRTLPGCHQLPPGALASQGAPRGGSKHIVWGVPRAYSSAAAAAPQPAPVGDPPLQLQLQLQDSAGSSVTVASDNTPGSSQLQDQQELPSLQDLLVSEEQRQRGGKHHFTLTPEQRAWLRDALTRMTGAADSKQRALEAYIPAKLWRRATPEYRRWMLRAINAPLLDYLTHPSRTQQEVDAILFNYFLHHCRHTYSQELGAYEAAANTMDLRAPESWYTYARSLKRKIYYHGGPTNSGKTYTALQALAGAQRGVYCGPLRLLAMEVYETLNAAGVRCDMVTGQEVVRVPGAAHVSCTVEMASLYHHADVAVVDEIQMIGDDQRGYAWTRALLGLPANEVHVCGDLSAVDLVRALAASCGDEFELVTYDRMTPLSLLPKGLPKGLSSVQPGDCLVAFSRKDIHSIRRRVEAATGLPTCVVYGALPAETRRAQARQFNDPSSPAKVLVASDAIGMGLNFNIRRVIFTTLSKRSATSMVPVPPALVKQIAGRAGRRNSNYPKGFVTTLHQRDMPALRKAMSLPLESFITPKAGLYPEFETIEMLSTVMPGTSFASLLQTFSDGALLEGRYFFSNQDALLLQARKLEEVPGLSLEDRYSFCMAPVPRGSIMVDTAFMEFACMYARGQPVTVDDALMPSGPPRSEGQMAYMEDLYKVVALWLWLSNRFEEEAFPGRHKVDAMARQLCNWMGASLASRRASPAAPHVLQQQAVARQAKEAGTAAAEASQEEEEEAIDFSFQMKDQQLQETAGAEGVTPAQGQSMGTSSSAHSSNSSSSPGWSQSSAAGSAWADVSSEEESDWEDADSPLADGAGLQLHVVHQHHHVGSVGSTSGGSSMLAAEHGSNTAITADNSSSGGSSSSSGGGGGGGGSTLCMGGRQSNSGSALLQQKVLPWVQEVNRAVAAGQVEEVLQPAWDSSMWRYVTCKSGWHSRLVVPPPPRSRSVAAGSSAEPQLLD